MATGIESFLFGQGGTHGVTEIRLSATRLALTVAPWEGSSSPTSVEFAGAKILSVDVYADGPDDLNLPWDIIGFESYPLPHDRWRFVLHCAGIEYVFESRWPVRVAGSTTPLNLF